MLDLISTIFSEARMLFSKHSSKAKLFVENLDTKLNTTCRRYIIKIKVKLHWFVHIIDICIDGAST